MIEPDGILQCGATLQDIYTIQGVLAANGLEITYKARVECSGDYVVVKEFAPVVLTEFPRRSHDVIPYAGRDEKFVAQKEKFIQDAEKLLSQFRYTHGVVKILDVFEENNTAYLVEEYHPGVTLKEYMKSHGNVTVDMAIHIAGSVISTLKDIQADGGIYGYLTLDNIFICDKNLEIILMDFFAQDYFFERRKEIPVPLYSDDVDDFFMMPPETWTYRRNDGLGGWTDVYELGMVLYYILTGRTYGFDQIKPYKYNSDVLGELNDIIMRAIELNPRDRYQNADEFMRALLGEKIKKPKKTRFYHRRSNRWTRG